MTDTTAPVVPLGEGANDRYITLVEIGEGTKFALNHWTNTVEYTPTDTNVVKAYFTTQEWTTLEEALPWARKMEGDSRYPGEQIYILRNVIYNDGDVEGVPEAYYYLAMGRYGSFDENR